MKFDQNKTIPVILITFLILTLAPLQGAAGIFLQTEAVSGTITAIKDDAVELNGSDTLYHPYKPAVRMTLKVGNKVTLLYYEDNRGEEPIKKYVKFASGLNSLKPSKEPSKGIKEKQ